MRHAATLVADTANLYPGKRYIITRSVFEIVFL